MNISTHELTRRGLMKLAAGTAVGLALPAGARAQQSTPKRGGHFKQALAGGSTSDSFEPGAMWDSAIQNISAQVRDTLVEVGSDFRPVAALADSWEPSADAKTWRFNLRKDVTFHNGKTFTSADVLFSINHHRGPDSISGAKNAVSNVADVKADGPNAVIFTLSIPSADFPMSLSDYHLPMMQEGTTDWSTSVGTGAYVVKGFEPGVRFTAKRNPNDWRTDRGYFDTVETLIINDGVARMNALVGRQVHAINRVDPKTAGLLERGGKFKLQNVPGTKHFTMPMLADTAPYSDNNVRLALKYAIDRQKIVDNVLQGYGYVGNDHPIARVNRYYNPDQVIRSYDPDKAQFYLKKANLANPVFELHTSDAAFAGAVDATSLYQEAARRAGVNIQLIREPADGYYTRVWMKAPFCTSYWSGRAVEDAILSLAYSSNSNSNESRFKNEKFDGLLFAARAEFDDEKRRQIYYEAQALLSDEGSAIVPVFLNFLQATSADIGFGEIGAFEDMDGNRSAVRWWFE